MKEIQDLVDWFPYCLLVALPVFIALSPMPVHAVAVAASASTVSSSSSAHDFPVHRLAHYELGGAIMGSKLAAVSMDARSAKADPSNLLRKVVVTRLHQMSVTDFNDLVASGAGAVLFLLPPEDGSGGGLSEEERRLSLQMEEHLLVSEIEIPIYFAHENEELAELVESLDRDTAGGTGKKVSAAETMFNAIASTGYQLVSAASAVPKQQPDPIMKGIEGTLRAKGEDESQPTVAVVAHYDSLGAAPTLSYGVDSNGSGVIVLLELARLFSRLYKSSKTQPSTNLVFLLAPGGKLNYFGTKKWLEDHLDASSSSELLTDVKFSLCLDTLGNVDQNAAAAAEGRKAASLNMHVSKPPKEDSHSGKFFAVLKSLAAASDSKKSEADFPVQAVNLVHKKINLADERLAWEHERFSIRRLPAFTMSTAETSESTNRLPTLMDKSLDPELVAANVRLIAESLACVVYDYDASACQGDMFEGETDSVVAKENVVKWAEYFEASPRFAGLLTSNKANNDPANKVVSTMFEALKTYTHGVRVLNQRRDKREPEFNFYDSAQTTMSAYKVKPAVFDLLLSMVIGGYLFAVYGFIIKSSLIVNKISKLINSTGGSGGKASANGSVDNGSAHKTNGHKATNLPPFNGAFMDSPRLKAH